MSTGRVSALILGISVFLGLSCLGYLLANAAIEYKQYERSVTVKGLSEREYQADVVIWPIQFSAADNDLKALYGTIENNIDSIREFLEKGGIAAEDISLMSPDITDKSANNYGSSSRPEFRYTALQTITIYSSHIEAVRSVISNSRNN
ncbi:SIMPL domain-containing protein [Endozoicomonas sp. ALE010]|uniref:SIMPL domain-containing protein n=1 Tax=Endozoicomonas sp. ALE010 TaxID=3403081 RepID=UPI003BB72930